MICQQCLSEFDMHNMIQMHALDTREKIRWTCLKCFALNSSVSMPEYRILQRMKIGRDSIFTQYKKDGQASLDIPLSPLNSHICYQVTENSMNITDYKFIHTLIDVVQRMGDHYLINLNVTFTRPEDADDSLAYISPISDNLLSVTFNKKILSMWSLGRLIGLLAHEVGIHSGTGIGYISPSFYNTCVHNMPKPVGLLTGENLFDEDYVFSNRLYLEQSAIYTDYSGDEIYDKLTNIHPADLKKFGDISDQKNAWDRSSGYYEHLVGSCYGTRRYESYRFTALLAANACIRHAENKKFGTQLAIEIMETWAADVSHNIASGYLVNDVSSIFQKHWARLCRDLDVYFKNTRLNNIYNIDPSLLTILKSASRNRFSILSLYGSTWYHLYSAMKKSTSQKRLY